MDAAAGRSGDAGHDQNGAVVIDVLEFKVGIKSSYFGLEPFVKEHRASSENVLDCLRDRTYEFSLFTREREGNFKTCGLLARRSICRQYLGQEGNLHVITLDPRLEEYIQNATEHTERTTG